MTETLWPFVALFFFFSTFYLEITVGSQLVVRNDTPCTCPPRSPDGDILPPPEYSLTTRKLAQSTCPIRSSAILPIWVCLSLGDVITLRRFQ